MSDKRNMRQNMRPQCFLSSLSWQAQQLPSGSPYEVIASRKEYVVTNREKNGRQ